MTKVSRAIYHSEQEIRLKCQDKDEQVSPKKTQTLKKKEGQSKNQ